ncbi:hypothetical protein F4808DRAFT_449728 [Astrocystis sublimbata]|nr:hypothetical protein F4808DRAFT_449728 [Astrocystis sublimbata]
MSAITKRDAENQGTCAHYPRTHRPFDLGDMSSSSTMLNADSISVLNAAETAGSLWQSGQSAHHMDYISVPDPPFSFTSLEFGSSPGLFTDYNDANAPTAAEVGQPNAQSWFEHVSDSQEFSHTAEALTAFERSEANSTPLGEGNERLPPATTSPLTPLMSTTQQQTCFNYFDRDVRPPASLAGIDPLGWLKIKRYILGKAQNAHKLMLDAFFAISTLLSATDMTFQSSLRPSFPAEMAAKVIVQGQGWNEGSIHLLQWLNLMDSKISVLGGRVLFLESALQVIRRAHFETSHPEIIDEDRNYHSHKPIAKPCRTKRLEYLLSNRSQSVPPLTVVRMDIFNIISYPAFEFHITSMSFARRIGGHDRHHRSRETPEDEFEVMEACRGFEEELQELWQHRPGILNLDASQLEHFVSKDIARELELLFSLYIATFWSHFIYIHRVAFWSLKHTAIVEKALVETGNMMRRSVGQSMDCFAFDDSITRTALNTIHPGLMWTCLVFALEIPDPVQQNWCVAQLRALGKLGSPDYTDHSKSTNGVLPFRIDKKGQQNALKVSRLLREVIDQQEKTKGRVDGRYISQELFGCTFYMI